MRVEYLEFDNVSFEDFSKLTTGFRSGAIFSGEEPAPATPEEWLVWHTEYEAQNAEMRTFAHVSLAENQNRYGNSVLVYTTCSEKCYEWYATSKSLVFDVKWGYSHSAARGLLDLYTPELDILSFDELDAVLHEKLHDFNMSIQAGNYPVMSNGWVLKALEFAI